MGREAWCAVVHGVARIGHDLATEQQQLHIHSRVAQLVKNLPALLETWV